MTIDLNQGMFLKSVDGEYVYNIFEIHEDGVITVDILNKNLEILASRQWSKEYLQKQIDNGTIERFEEKNDETK